MELNLPILDRLAGCRNLLIAGMGGGFDVFSGLPLYFALRGQGRTVHLANLSFSELDALPDPVRLSPSLFGIRFDHDEFYPYFPELYLAQWFKEHRGEDVTIWCFKSTGVGPLRESYKTLIKHLAIDGIVLVDGGMDSLTRGDESELGTLAEDATSLCAMSELSEVPIRILVCTALGVEQDLGHAHVLENIAGITREGGFLGCCGLAPAMAAFQAFEEAVLYVQGKRHHNSSVINSSIISAVRGHYGDYHLTEKTKGSRLWISPLMTLYWFFDLQTVAGQNLLLPDLRDTCTTRDVWEVIFAFRQRGVRRRSRGIVQF